MVRAIYIDSALRVPYGNVGVHSSFVFFARLVYGGIRECRLSIPWQSLRTDNVLIHLDVVQLVLRRKRKALCCCRRHHLLSSHASSSFPGAGSFSGEQRNQPDSCRGGERWCRRLDGGGEPCTQAARSSARGVRGGGHPLLSHPCSGDSAGGEGPLCGSEADCARVGGSLINETGLTGFGERAEQDSRDFPDLRSASNSLAASTSSSFARQTGESWFQSILASILSNTAVRISNAVLKYHDGPHTASVSLGLLLLEPEHRASPKLPFSQPAAPLSTYPDSHDPHCRPGSGPGAGGPNAPYGATRGSQRTGGDGGRKESTSQAHPLLAFLKLQQAGYPSSLPAASSAGGGTSHTPDGQGQQPLFVHRLCRVKDLTVCVDTQDELRFEPDRDQATGRLRPSCSFLCPSLLPHVHQEKLGLTSVLFPL